MGKLKHNWKARQNPSNSELKKPSSKEEIKLDLDIPLDDSKYDESNIFALPSKKEKSENIKIKPVPSQKHLSKKEKKKIAQKKRRQMKRLKQKELLDDLQKVQISNEELLLMTSITDAQTKGRRKFLKEEKISKIPTEVIQKKDSKINIKGKKKRRNCDLDALPENKKKTDEIKVGDEKLEIISDDNSEDKTIESPENIHAKQKNNLDSILRKNMKSEFQNKLLFMKGEKTDTNNSTIQKSEKVKNKMAGPLVFYPKPTLYERKILKKSLRKQMRMERKKHHQDLLNSYDKNASTVEFEPIQNESVLKQEIIKLSEKKNVDIRISNKNTPISTEMIKEKLNSSKIESTEQPEENESNKLNNKSDEKLYLQKANVAESPKVQFILLERIPEIQNARLALPILPEEHIIMESISENPVVIICGQTGSGKTTQVPQFLYEAGYSNNKGIIGITQPRRIAATSLAERVAHEMNVSKKIVSYQIRFEGNVTEETKIKFMTDGILLKEIQKDYLLTKYNVIIIDEAHERSMHTDLLIGLLSSVVQLRAKQGNTLKVIIMSATLRIQDFTENKSLFEKPPPVIKINSRQFPVTIHFNRRTPVEDYIEAAYKKVCRIHQELPEGGILVFVTGRDEVLRLCRKLRKTFPFTQYKNNNNATKKSKMQKLDDFMDNPETLKKIRKQCSYSKQNSKLDILDIDLDKYSVQPMDEEILLEQAESDDEEDFFDEDFENNLNFVGTEPMLVLPLYSLLPLNKQAQVFQTPPDGTRLCVIATNVAETSLTIPNIKYVVDTGKIKRRVFDKKCGLSTFVITWTSQASANQRAGRAGRTGSGHCYRLYSSSAFINEFPKFSPPEITLRPIDDIVLYMKELGIIDIGNFKFPTPPDLTTIKASEERLLQLGALEKEIRIVNGSERSGYKITHLGRIMTHFSVNPRFGKMIACSFKNDVMPYTIIIVAALSVREIFLDSYLANIDDDDDDSKNISENKKWKSLRMQWAELDCSHGLGDIMVLLKAVGGTEHIGLTKKVCDDNGLRYNALLEIRKLRSQLTKEVNLLSSKQNFCMDPKLPVPSESQKEYLCRLILAIGIDHVARKIPENEIIKENKKKFKNAYQCQFLEEPVFIHPESVLYQQAPPFVVFQEILETSRKYMKVVSAINPSWIPLVANQLCSFSKPLESPPPRYDSEKDEILCHMTSIFGQQKWQLPAVELKFPSTVARYSWFGRFFLEGEVMSELKKYNQHLIISAANMIKHWAKFQQRTQYILNDLINKQIDSKKALMNIWEKDPKYLLWSYCQWLPSELHLEVSHIWPPKS